MLAVATGGEISSTPGPAAAVVAGPLPTLALVMSPRAAAEVTSGWATVSGAGAAGARECWLPNNSMASNAIVMTAAPGPGAGDSDAAASADGSACVLGSGMKVMCACTRAAAH
jgi:hypothetical protein